ncbi:MAG: GNAT family N-acetyltransferase [Candidatus Kariarchaeaceae archaeon]
MKQKFYILDSRDSYVEYKEEMVKINAEYDIWRIKDLHQRFPEIYNEIWKNANTSFEELLNLLQHTQSTGEITDEYHNWLLGLFDGAYTHLLLVKNHNIAGQGALGYLKDDIGEVRSMYVKPKFRGQGFGYTILEKILQKAKEIGFTTLYLDTLDTMKSAIKLYESFGFKRREYYKIPDFPKELSEKIGSIFFELHIS